MEVKTFLFKCSLVFLGPSVLNLGLMYATDRCQTSRRKSSLNAPTLGDRKGIRSVNKRGHNSNQICIKQLMHRPSTPHHSSPKKYCHKS